jgi:hypothetical protein
MRISIFVRMAARRAPVRRSYIFSGITAIDLFEPWDDPSDGAG